MDVDRGRTVGRDPKQTVFGAHGEGDGIEHLGRRRPVQRRAEQTKDFVDQVGTRKDHLLAKGGTGEIPTREFGRGDAERRKHERRLGAV
jgi:hypothetical protein